jgi:hypothetical protein
LQLQIPKFSLHPVKKAIELNEFKETFSEAARKLFRQRLQLFQKGAYVLVPDAQFGFVPARVISHTEGSLSLISMSYYCCAVSLTFGRQADRESG